MHNVVMLNSCKRNSFFFFLILSLVIWQLWQELSFHVRNSTRQQLLKLRVDCGLASRKNESWNCNSDSSSIDNVVLSNTSLDMDMDMDMDIIAHNITNQSELEQQTVAFVDIKTNYGNSIQISNNLGTSCCFSQVDVKHLDEKFTQEFFDRIMENQERSGNELEEWHRIRNRTLSLSSFCRRQWYFLLLDENDGFYLRLIMKALLQLPHNKVEMLPFSPELTTMQASVDASNTADSGAALIPRVLFLGDSISRGVWIAFMKRHEKLQKKGSKTEQFFAVGAPTNCGGFQNYEKRLKVWLGSCPWDIVHFNVGMHFHPSNFSVEKWHQEYRVGITAILKEIRSHSPLAHIIIATTTPSPFDSNATYPINPQTCQNYHKFHPTGFVSDLNSVLLRVIEEEEWSNVTINDRYSAIYPVLGKYQRPCDIHYRDKGYALLADQDRKIIREVLKL